MVRPNTVLPVGANENRPDYEYADGIGFRVFALDEGATATARVPAHDGSTAATVELRRVGTRIEISVQGAASTSERAPALARAADVPDGTAMI